MRGFFLQVYTIARYELLLQFRSMGFWILLLVLSAATGFIAFSQHSTLYAYISNGQAAVTTASNEVTFFCCLLPLLFLNVFGRDKQRRVQAQLWTRPFTSFTYVLGKSGASIVISLLVIWPPLLIGWGVVSIASGTLQAIEPWLILLLINGAAAILVALFSLLCITLIPIPVLGAIIPAGISVYLNIVQAKSMILLTNLTASSLFFSPTIGLGPDTELVTWQRVTYMLGAAAALGFLLLVYQRYQQHGIARLRHYFTAILIILLAGALTVLSSNTFQASVASEQDLGNTSTPLSSAQTSQYNLNVQVNPTTGHIQGTATFQLTIASSKVTTFTVAMNPGLQVQQITASNTAQTLPFTQKYGWTTIQLQDTALQPGHPVTLHINYAGSITIGRDNYASAVPGWGSANDVVTSVDYFYLSYLGQGAGMLQGAAGSWYPLPWTTQAVTNDGTRVPIDTLQLRAPSSVGMYNAFGTKTKETSDSEGQWQELDLTPHASLPVAFAAFLQHPQAAQIANTTVWYQGSAPDTAEIHSDTSIIQSLNTLRQWLEKSDTSPALQIVRMPLLTQPFVGKGLLLIPEQPLVLDGIPITQTTTNRIAADEIAHAWWLDHTAVPFELEGDSGSDMQIPYATSGLAPNSDAYTMLAAYSGMVVADKMMNNHFQATEVNVCQRAYKYDQESNLSSSNQQTVNDITKLNHDRINIGLPYCTYSELVLYNLQQRVGLAKVTTLLQSYAVKHGQQTVGTREFLTQASAVAGSNLVPGAAPYICSGRMAVQKGASDPLACLTEAGQQ